MYEALGLNEESLNTVSTIVNMGLHATDIAGSFVLKAMSIINSFDLHNFPMSAAASALQIVKSFTDVYIQMLLDMYGVYAEMIIQFIVDPGSALELVFQQLYEILNKIENLIYEQIEKYLGMSITEIKYYVQQGINLYKAYKDAKKKIRDYKEEQKRKKEERNAQKEQDVGINDKGSSYSVDVDIDINDPKEIWKQLKAYMEQLGDGLYNGFIVLQVMDMVKQIKTVIRQSTDISLESLASDINDLEDFIDLLDEIGLGDDSTAVDLSMIPALGINSVMASLESLKELSAMGVAADVMRIGASNVAVSGSGVSKKTDYEIKTDAESKTITVTYYTDPTKSSVSKRVYKAFSGAKNAEGVNLFTLSECKIIQDNIDKLWNESGKTGSGSSEFECGQYNIVLVLNIQNDKDESQAEKSADEEQDLRPEDIDVSMFEVLEQANTETYRNKEDVMREKKRNTIKLLHTLYSIIKTVVPPLKILIVLIANYKENKAYVRSNQEEALGIIVADALKRLGFDKELDSKGDYIGPDGKPAKKSVFPIRSLAFKEFIDSLEIPFGDDVLSMRPCMESEIKKINIWLTKNDKDAPLIEFGSTTYLFIDLDALAEERECIRKRAAMIADVASQEDVARLLGMSCA